MTNRDVLVQLAEELARAVEPLALAARTPGALRDLLEDLGWDFETVPTAIGKLLVPVEQLYNLVSPTEEISAADTPILLNGVRAVFSAIADISNAPGLPAGFAEGFPDELVDYLLYEYFFSHQPRWGHLLASFGILRAEDMDATGGRPAYTKRIIAFSDLARLTTEPLAVFRDAYLWGDSEFRGEILLDALQGMLEAWQLNVRESVVEDIMLQQLNAGALTPESSYDTCLQLAIIESESDADFDVGVALFIMPETAAVKPGFTLLPYSSTGIEKNVELSPYLILSIEGTVALDGGVGIIIRPGQLPQLLVGFGTGLPSVASGMLSIALVLSDEGNPRVLIGTPGASHFEVGGTSILGGTRFHGNDSFEVFLEFALAGAKIVIKPGDGEADGFLARLLPEEGMSIGTNLTVGFSTTQGIYFGGSGGLEISIPAHIQLGPIEVLNALLAVRAKDTILAVDLAASIKGDLNVLTAVIENIGVTAMFTFPDNGKGNLGPVNLAMKFRPPNGVGLSIDAGVVKGGGYLYLDIEKGEYAGALELTVANFLSLKAIGLINTKLPGGQPGFSMLAIITAEFNPGFQLGFGFTLLGVGGLLGLNRGMLLEPLVSGIRTGAINSILFPINVIENAPRIISDLRTIFPPKEGTFLIGPMAKIGWGTPTLVSISLGVIIEIPGNAVILGRIRVALPTDEAAIIVLQSSFIGALEFDKRRIWFFASLFESRLLFITLDGELGLLMDYSDNANFVLSVGGFHPRFTAPPLPFPSPTRIALSLINGKYARVRVELYLAITSNTVQTGAQAEAFFGFDALSVEGYFNFDALIRFSPLYLIVEISCGFAVKVFGLGVYGIHLRAALEGPTPWHIAGAAELEFFFFTVSVDVEVTFGERRTDTLPPLPLLPALKAELEKLDSWRTALPASGRLLVSLRNLGDPGLLVLHPVGTLRISQRLVPLSIPLDKVGNQTLSDIYRAAVTVDAGLLAVRQPVQDQFAKAQYVEMDDAAKLSAPAFEMLQSGVELSAGAAWATGPSAQRIVRYETIIVDTQVERTPIRYFQFWPGLFAHFIKGGAIAKAELSQAKEEKLKPFTARINVQPDGYVVANTADNTALSGAALFTSHTEATTYLASVLRENPSLGEAIHVIPSAEVNVAA